MASDRIFDRVHQLEITPIGGEAIFIQADQYSEHLIFDFEVKKHRGIDYDTANLNIYNLNRDTQKRIRKPYKPEYETTHMINLHSGYMLDKASNKVDLSLLFEGEIWRAEPSPDYSNATTKYVLTCTTALGLLSKRRDVNLPEETDAKKAAEAAAQQAGAKMSFTENALKALKKHFLNGKSFSENLKEIFDMLAKDTAVEFTATADGTIVASLPGEPLNSEAIDIPNGTIIQPPRYTERGIILTTLLMPVITPGAYIRPESGWLAGYAAEYTVEEMTHKGDTWSGQCSTEMDCIAYPANI